MTQVARKDVGDMNRRQQIRDRLTYQDEKTERAHSLLRSNETQDQRRLPRANAN